MFGRQRIRAFLQTGRRPLMIAIAATLALGGANLAQAQAIDIVTVEGGQVQGVETDVAGVKVFKGIPFAGPTGGENRFKAPQPVEPWTGVKVADTWGDQALQPGGPPEGFWYNEFYYDPAYIPAASENGLNLNVWTPAASATDKLPVYVWIHGGGNHHGNASEIEFYASKLAEKGIVVVSVQYRVGAPGFLALSELSSESPNKVSGNYGMLDLIQALHWVKDNIAGFGGDPDTVTVGGQSAGGRNTTMLLRSPLADGLYKRVVIQSAILGLFPSPVTPLAERETANAAGVETVFGKPMTVEELRAIPAEDFLKPLAEGQPVLFDALHGATNAPAQHAIDGYVFPQDDFDLLKDGALEGIDIMIGGTSDEFTSLFDGPENTMADADFASAMSGLGYGDGWKDVYVPADPTDAYRLSLRARSDNALQNYLVSAGIAQARNDDLDVYSYYFSHNPPGRNSEFYGSYHSSELWYFMNSMREQEGQRPWTEADFKMADIMSTYLANFVKTGNPNGEGLTEWPQTTLEDGLQFIHFDEGEAKVAASTPFPERDELNREAVIEAQQLQDEPLLK